MNPYNMLDKKTCSINNTIHLKLHEQQFKKKIINFILISLTKN